MSNMYLVINFCASSNFCDGSNASINGTVGTNFYSIFKYHRSTTFHFFKPLVSIFFGVIIECIATNDGACLYNNVVSNNGVIEYANTRINSTIFSNAYMVTNKSLRHNISAFSYESACCYRFCRF